MSGEVKFQCSVCQKELDIEEVRNENGITVIEIEPCNHKLGG